MKRNLIHLFHLSLFPQIPGWVISTYFILSTFYETITPCFFSPMEELIDTWRHRDLWIPQLGKVVCMEGFWFQGQVSMESSLAGLLTSSTDMIDRPPDATCYCICTMRGFMWRNSQGPCFPKHKSLLGKKDIYLNKCSQGGWLEFEEAESKLVFLYFRKVSVLWSLFSLKNIHFYFIWLVLNLLITACGIFSYYMLTLSSSLEI